jgi:hypothetical protein
VNAARAVTLKARARDRRRRYRGLPDRRREPGANVVAMLLIRTCGDRAEQSPYPQPRALLAAHDGTEPVAGLRGFRFADPRHRQGDEAR